MAVIQAEKVLERPPTAIEIFVQASMTEKINIKSVF
jgi:hypothetical protein